MKRLMLIGPSQCGKTSLTRYCVAKPCAIRKPGHRLDAGRHRYPGEYLENRCLYSALLTSACEADVIALVLNADAPGHLFLRFTAPMNRPVIGVITKADLAAARLQQVRTWLETAGAGHIFITSALTGDGLDDLFACLNAEEYQ